MQWSLLRVCGRRMCLKRGAVGCGSTETTEGAAKGLHIVASMIPVRGATA
jgi:hypothetical protein